MLRLKRQNEAPAGGFSYKDKQTGWNAHQWSFRMLCAQVYQYKVKKGEKTTPEHTAAEVEKYVCQELVAHHPQWTEWVQCDSEYEALAPLDDFERDLGSPKYEGRFMVVFPFCAKDGPLAVKSMQWTSEITTPCQHEILLSYDNGTPKSVVDEVNVLARKVFKTVTAFKYNGPRGGQWPPTIAFREAAKKMMELGKPWLWLEYDCIPLKPDWVDIIQDEYWKCGKAFAGPIVPDMGHMNGTGIYPSNTPRRIPRALSLVRTAWDITMKQEMIQDCHNLHPTLFHTWGVYNGRLHPYLGEPPQFPPGTKLLEQIPPESALFHRDKGVQSPERLRERKLVTA